MTAAASGRAATEPEELAELRERAAELADLGSIGALLFWDQSTYMPAGGAVARAEHLGTLERIHHSRLTDPALGKLLDALEPWADGEDPDSAAVRLVRWTRRDAEKATRVPADLAAEMSRAGAFGQQAWQQARERDDFAPFHDALARQIELRHRYAACFEGTGAYAHPYDVLLDDFEPELTTAELKPLFGELRAALVPLVAAAVPVPAPDPVGVPVPLEVQRATVADVLAAVGFKAGAWRLDESVHPFAQSLSPTDVRITTRWDEDDFSFALYSSLHEFGHGLYEAQIDPALYRTTLGVAVGLGVHESQSRLWENVVGRSRAFARWLAPRLPVATDGDALFRGLNAVRPSLVRIEADETTYNLHIVLRFELELALMEGRLEVADLPEAWAEGMRRLLGVEVPGPLQGVLQDIHWGAGLIGYFPTYTLGNLMAAQLWKRIAADVPGVADDIERGEFGALREWLREHVHRHGRLFAPRDLLRRATGEELTVEPFVRYLRDKLEDAGALAS